MTRKKKSHVELASSDNPIEPTVAPTAVNGNPKPAASSSEGGKASKSKPSEPTTSALIICRNKHWRYISSFHGPWLQLPPEVLESLAYSNYLSPRPHPIDPAVFFDLVKIRRLIEEATDLSVRAANGTTSSSLTNSLNAGNGLSSGGGAASLGLGLGSGGANAKLSRERKHRMREHATQKLSRAYHLDEIAASVATMQSASALEEVAKLVLQRNEHDADAKYVHFFHEKIPSRSLASCTSLKPLDEIIASHSGEGAPYRTRAITRMFKDDYPGAARDLSEGLAVWRMWQKDNIGQDLVKVDDKEKNGVPRDLKYDVKLDEKDHPSSLEPQLLFHRAGTYLTIACQHIHAALNGLDRAKGLDSAEATIGETPVVLKEDHRQRLDARKIVKTNAKRALRDYISFLSHFDYTPGLPIEITEEFFRKVNAAASGFTLPRPTHSNRLLDLAAQSNHNGRTSDALVRRKDVGPQEKDAKGDYVDPTTYPPLPPPEIHQVSSLFSSIPLLNLPPYPIESTALVTRKQQQTLPSTQNGLALLASHDCHEAITYHPLLTDALHSLLLCHCLIQTSPKELLRHAHMSARLARVCDGYPIFLAARSPARADWIEVIRRAENWIGLQQTWENLCAPAPLPGHAGAGNKKETPEQARERQKHEAVMEALADERMQDEESFRAAVRAREKRAEEERKQNAGDEPRRWAQEDGKEYPISTERADAIARWIREAPVGSVDGESKARKGGKKAKARNGHVETATGMETGLNLLSIYGEHE